MCANQLKGASSFPRERSAFLGSLCAQLKGASFLIVGLAIPDSWLTCEPARV